MSPKVELYKVQLRDEAGNNYFYMYEAFDIAHALERAEVNKKHFKQSGAIIAIQLVEPTEE